MPQRTSRLPPVPFRPRPVPPPIRAHPPLHQLLPRIRNRPQMPPPARQSIIPPRLLVVPHSRFPPRVISVVMILVRRHHRFRRIHHRRALPQRLPHQPVVPMHPPQHQLRHPARIQSAPKRKIIDPLRPPLPGASLRQPPQPLLPIPSRKVVSRRDVHVPPPPHQQKFLPLRRHSFQRPPEISHQQNVAVAVAQHLVPRHLRRPRKQVIHPLRSPRAPLHVPLVPQPQLPRHLRRSLFLPKQNHLHLRPQPFPTPQRVPLDHRLMSHKWLRRSEQGEHGCPRPFRRSQFQFRQGTLAPNSPRRIPSAHGFHRAATSTTQLAWLWPRAPPPGQHTCRKRIATLVNKYANSK